MISDREKLVLGAIVEYYLINGGTIGSRTLVKKYNIQYSSATIRNVMADLEDMGYLKKTHTSSGRIPTDKGYKFYLDELLKIEALSIQEMENIRELYRRKTQEFEGILKQTSNLLSKLTTYAGIAFEPRISRETIKKVELVHIDDYTTLAVIVMDDSTVKTKKIFFDKKVDEVSLKAMGSELNKRISKEEVQPLELESLMQEMQNPLLEAITTDVYQDMEGELFINGTSTLLQDKTLEEAGEAMKILEKKQGLDQLFKKLIDTKSHQEGGVYVVFGDELEIHGLEDLSFVYSVYKNGSSQGVIGVIGPKRMAYSKTVGLVEYVTGELNRKLIKVKERGDKND